MLEREGADPQQTHLPSLVGALGSGLLCCSSIWGLLRPGISLVLVLQPASTHRGQLLQDQTATTRIHTGLTWPPQRGAAAPAGRLHTHLRPPTTPGDRAPEAAEELQEKPDR